MKGKGFTVTKIENSKMVLEPNPEGGDPFVVPYQTCSEKGKDIVDCNYDSDETFICKNDGAKFYCRSNYGNETRGKIIKTPYIRSVEQFKRDIQRAEENMAQGEYIIELNQRGAEK